MREDDRRSYIHLVWLGNYLDKNVLFMDGLSEHIQSLVIVIYTNSISSTCLLITSLTFCPTFKPKIKFPSHTPLLRHSHLNNSHRYCWIIFYGRTSAQTIVVKCHVGNIEIKCFK